MLLKAAAIVVVLGMPGIVGHGHVACDCFHWNDLVVRDRVVGSLHEAVMVCVEKPGITHIVAYREADLRPGLSRGDWILYVANTGLPHKPRESEGEEYGTRDLMPKDYQLRR